MEMHEYHCVLCGKRLWELNIGLLQCQPCGVIFLPTQKDSAYSLTWVVPEGGKEDSDG